MTTRTVTLRKPVISGTAKTVPIPTQSNNSSNSDTDPDTELSSSKKITNVRLSQLHYNPDPSNDLSEDPSKDCVKKVSIIGQNNKYRIKKINTPIPPKVVRKLITRENIPDVYFDSASDAQINVLRKIIDNGYDAYDDISRIFVQEISLKISGYRSQDRVKNRQVPFEKAAVLTVDTANTFITVKTIIDAMVADDIKCKYCRCRVNILYRIVREMTQWSCDRIDNDLAHLSSNVVIACLRCNIQRRKQQMDGFLFTKHLKLIRGT